MWKELQKSPSFFLFFLERCKYHILITDYIKIWEVYYTEDDFLNCLKDSNFGLEIDTHELIEKGTQMLLKPNELKTLNISQNELFLNVSMTKFYGYPLHLNIKLKEGSPDLFFQKVTQELLRTVKDLRCSEHHLRILLQKKDKEIEEYKALGGKIRYTTIPSYNDETHMQKHSVYHKNFGDMEVPNIILERTVFVPQKNIMEVDNDNKIKQEPISQELVYSNGINLDLLNTVKQESVKTESQPLIPKRKKKKKMLNL